MVVSVEVDVDVDMDVVEEVDRAEVLLGSVLDDDDELLAGVEELDVSAADVADPLAELSLPGRDHM